MLYISHNFAGRGEDFKGTLNAAVKRAKEIADKYGDCHYCIIYDGSEIVQRVGSF